jgi:hypothetical protein
VISSIESKSDQSKQGIAMSYRMKIEEELKDICNQVLQLLDDHLIAKASTPESKVNTRAHTHSLVTPGRVPAYPLGIFSVAALAN